MTPPQDAATAGTVDREESSVSLLAQLAESVSTIFRKESELLRAEIDQKARQAAAAIGMIAGGALILLTVSCMMIRTFWPPRSSPRSPSSASSRAGRR